MSEEISISFPVRQNIVGTLMRLKFHKHEFGKNDLNLAIDKSKCTEENLKFLGEQEFLLHNESMKLKNCIQDINECQNKWEDFMKNLNHDELKIEMMIYKKFMEKENFYDEIGQSKDLLCNIDMKLFELNGLMSRLTNENAYQINTDKNYSTFVPVKINLPKLQLTIFYGDSLKWKEFWDSFESSIDSQNIPDVQKFQYLLTVLKGSAYKHIEGLSVTNTNYKIAIQLLKERFGDPSVISSSLFTELRNIPVSSSKLNDLRNTVEKIKKIWRQLESLGEETKSSVFNVLILEKFPQNILYELGKEADLDKGWHIEELLDAIGRIITVKEKVMRISQKNDDYEYKARENKSNHNNIGKNITQNYFTGNKLDSAPEKSDEKEKSKIFPCAFCQGNHFNDQCNICKTVDERKKKILEKKLCFMCLKTGHSTRDCKFTKPCFHCQGHHNRAMCFKNFGNKQMINPTFNSNNDQGTSRNLHGIKPSHINQNIVESSNEIEENQIAIQSDTNNHSLTSHIELNQTFFDPNAISLLLARGMIINTVTSTKIKANIFFDSGSHKSYISNELKTKLNLVGENEEIISVFTFGAKVPQKMKGSTVKLGIILENNSVQEVYATSIDHIASKISLVKVTNDDIQFLNKHCSKNDILINDLCREHEDIKPDILIGMDYFWEFLDNSEKIKLPSGLYLIHTKLGYICSGKIDSPKNNMVQNVISSETFTDDDDIIFENLSNTTSHKNIENFWDLETIGIKDSPYVSDDDLALQNFNDSVKIVEGRYEVKWPWKHPNIDLPDNFGLSLGRLKSNLNRFKTDPDLLEKYDSIIKEQENKGIIEKIDIFDSNNNVKHYLPHHPVITPHKNTTKVRIVYDASSKVRKNLNSLNDCLYRGPLMLPDLCGVLLRFRLMNIAIIADIEKAFLQLQLNETDRDVTRFLWFKEPSKLIWENNLCAYRFCRVPFGVISSPFLLNACLRYHLQKHTSKTATKILRNMYVDNIIIDADSIIEALQNYKETKEIFKNATMNLREWVSNCSFFNEKLSEEDQMKDNKISILGIHWNNETDILSIPIIGDSEKLTLTKRTISKTVASTFDPLGLVSPIILKGKLFLQKLWTQNLSWDEILPKLLTDEWNSIIKDLGVNEKICIPRLILSEKNSETKYYLISFVDASQKAYATTIYLKAVNPKFSQVNLIFSKNRLAPLKSITLPRLELMGLFIGHKALTFAEKELDLKIEKKYIFCDSEIVLNWIKTSKPLETFVENRLKIIRNSNIEFRHISGLENSADIATRGLTLKELQLNSLWWNGPKWLSQPEQEWPLPNILFMTPITHVEVNNSINIGNIDQTSVIDLKNYSNIGKACRIMSYVLKFIKKKIWSKIQENSKNNFSWFKTVFEKVQNGPITASDMKISEKIFIKRAQQKFLDAIDEHGNLKELKNLGAKIDQIGIIRCYGRMHNSDLKNHKKYPILLPRKEKITELIVSYIHDKIMHFGVNHTLCEIRQGYWIPKGRSEVKRILRNCLICRKYTATPYPLPIIPHLPKERVCKSRPFQFVGIDYAGPLTIKIREESSKVWICLFTCFTTRAIHLEYILDLTAISFLNSLRRFISRRGKPDKIISDNASQFKLTNNVLDNVWNNIQKDEKINYYFSAEKIEWNFIVPLAPWQGGFYERLVGLIKNCLRKSIGKRTLKFDEFLTMINEVEAVINSRPLTYISDEAEKLTILRPIDLLMPFAFIGTPIKETHNNNDPEYLAPLNSTQKLEKYWKSSINILDHFWDIWYSDYLSNLRNRTTLEHKHKYLESKIEPKIDEIVIIKEDNQYRSYWKLGRIINLNKGKDEFARSAEVKLGDQTVVKRPINNLYPLEISPNEIEQDNSNSTEHSFEFFANLKFPIMLITILSLFSLTNAQLINKISKSFECNDTSSEIEFYDQCVKNGYVIYHRNQNDNQFQYCYKHLVCPEGYFIFNGLCTQDCICPKWASECFEDIDNKTLPKNSKEILRFGEPNICSYEKDDNCADTSVKEKIPKILLYNNQSYLVKDLTLLFNVINYQIICEGEGQETGTPEFCKFHVCFKNGTKFCFVKKKEIVSYVNQDGSIPIKAYGHSLISYYPIKTINISPCCTEFMVECFKKGVKFQFSELPSNLKVCSLPYCFEFSNLESSFEVQFPKEILIKNYEVIIEIWNHGMLINKSFINCPSSTFCEIIDCYFCWENVQNPQCYSIGYYFIIGVIMYSLSIILYILFKIFKIIKYFIILIKICYKGIIAAVNYVYFRCLGYKLLNQMKSDSHELQAGKASTSYGKSSSKSTYVITTICLILILLQNVESCADTVSFTATTSQCAIDKNNLQTCTFNEITKLLLKPQGQITCLLIKNNKSEPSGTISIEIRRIYLSCKKNTEYFTHSYKMHVTSSKRCNWMGSCSDKKCIAIKTDSIIPELNSESNKFPGYSFCIDSCGCAACGCFSCDSACLFYRIYAKPINYYVYEIFSCPIWEYKIQLEVKIVEFDSEKYETFVISPGNPIEWANLKFIVTSITQPPMPILGKKFMTNNRNMFMVSASDAGQLVAGMIGDYQCKSHKDAENSNCILSPNICNCHPQDLHMSCACKEQNLEAYFDDETSFLPIKTQGLYIYNDKSNVEADVKQYIILEAHVEMQGLHLVNKYDKNTCFVSFIKFEGCYNCLTGAKLTTECITDHGNTLAYIQCESISFSLKCSNKKIQTSTILNVDRANFNETCKVKCSGGITDLNIHATLIFISARINSKFENIIAISPDKPGNGINFDLGFSFTKLFDNWKHTFITVGIVIICVIISILMLPFIIQLILSGLCYLKGKLLSVHKKNN